MEERKHKTESEIEGHPPKQASPPVALTHADYNKEGREIDVSLLRALAFGRKRSSEIQLLLDGAFERSAHKSAVMRNSQMLALLLADLSVPENKASSTFKHLLRHQQRLNSELHRPVGVKTAAMDYLENIERALKIKDDDDSPTYSQLTQMAFTDQLTGLANYRFFSQRLRDEVKRCERYGHLLSLLMADIDHFKQFNDRYGHPAGNRALSQVARTLYAEVRDTDLLARYGGEEFALILPHTTKLEAQNLAERIRSHVKSMFVHVDERNAVQLSICVGIATLPRDALDEDSLVVAADQALYQAKQAGRNCVRSFAPATHAHFHFTPPLNARPNKISVVGSFNDWKPDADTMKHSEDGAFDLDIPLTPGRYLYKYVIDGKEYLRDPACELYEPDNFGGINCVAIVHPANAPTAPE